MVRDDVQSVAAALLKPRADYVQRVGSVRDEVVARTVEVARLLGVFLDRISDLSVDELRELHDETFQRLPGVVRLTAARLANRPVTTTDTRIALGVLSSALARLEADRNPFAYVVNALCCLLVARANSTGHEP